jgi:hypothetical protein
MASLGGMEMWCGRMSFSPFMLRRNCMQQTLAHARGRSDSSR